MPAKDIRITGRVQGVLFRAEAQEHASRLHLTGFVRNEKAGSVFIHAEGSTVALQAFIGWCHKGPSRAEVHAVHVEDVPEEGFPAFTVEY